MTVANRSRIARTRTVNEASLLKFLGGVAAYNVACDSSRTATAQIVR
jgi:hypothetical protein